MGWTIDELNALLAGYPEGTQAFPDTTASGMLHELCTFNMEEFVDWNTGKCSFNSDAFIKLWILPRSIPLKSTGKTRKEKALWT